MSEEEIKEKKKKKRVATVFAYIFILVVLVAVFPVVLPMIFKYTMHFCGTDTTGNVFKYGSVVYTKNIAMSSYSEGKLVAITAANGKAHTVDVYYVDVNNGDSLLLRDGSTVSTDDVKGNVLAQTPLVGYLCQFTFKVPGIIGEVIVFAAGVWLAAYANKIRKELAQIEDKDKEKQ